jgi:hypothetical protein
MLGEQAVFRLSRGKMANGEWRIANSE